MARRVLVAPRAAEGFRCARNGLTQHGSGPVGHQRWQELKKAKTQIRLAPCRWPISTDLPGKRKFSVEGYQIIYSVEPDTGDNETAGDVNILAVFGPGQEISLIQEIE